MLGIVIKYMDKVYKVGQPNGGVTMSSCIVRDEFILEANGMSYPCVGIFQKLRNGIEFDVEIAEFDEASEPLSENNPPIIETDYAKMIEADSEWDWKLKNFRKIEAILKEEGLLD